jgi:hypothetical protein
MDAGVFAARDLLPNFQLTYHAEVLEPSAKLDNEANDFNQIYQMEHSELSHALNPTAGGFFTCLSAAHYLNEPSPGQTVNTCFRKCKPCNIWRKHAHLRAA